MKKVVQMLIMIIVVMSLFACTSTVKDTECVSIVTIDVNPSIALRLNQKDEVVEVVAVNADAKKLIETMELENVSFDVALYAIVGAMVQNQYLTTEQNTILVSVQSDDVTIQNRLKEQLHNEMTDFLNNQEISGAILTKTLTANETLEQMSKKYDISLAKASLVNELVANKGSYTEEDLVKLSTQELVVLYENQNVETEDTTLTGEVNTTQYISKEEALAIALKDANTTKDKISKLEIEFDYERGRLTYEIEFYVGNVEYDYEIDALDQTIVKEVENKQNTSVSTSTIISKEKALSIAYADANVSSSDVKRLEVELDKKDAKYEIEFHVGQKEYSYEISTVNGKILEKEVEIDD